ncbi:hypothetical protein BWI97_07085 [Siphonobacter sp. BAB-5405]|uniref:GmrSD restriction endonuclease domain-containing protein n=1 Tax=Siphonobacter sp. BAB-5405 TaxID=1864825 RepID=UPI000C80B835|nr:DUF262 domain-containing protein [Siphonobacter sp. BAB-5405]PMD97386.1 hypothetical protein BWI97_07085 [Siphonobacter sp. BAB-5405]
MAVNQKLLVNLDAMIARADFAQVDDNDNSFELIQSIPVRDVSSEGMTGNLLRKPDFQRETNHWTPEQVVSLLECFINGDLIPSVILWKSPTYVFVIDGGHRLSVLRAWTEDDYGDGPISKKLFGEAISTNQLRAAKKTRELIAAKIGTYQHLRSRLASNDIDSKLSSTFSRALPVQWVKGNAEKAEDSFFKINTRGTPLDEVEESLLRNRLHPIPVSARAIIRAGKGNKYWSKFNPENIQEVERLAKELHVSLFDPEVSAPLKTLDLPLGGSKGIRTALQILIEFLQISCISNSNKEVSINYGEPDITGEHTVQVLRRANKLSSRITGNENGSLGLHPAIYFYGHSGIHSSPLFLGTAKFISEKLANNDKEFFKKFTRVRAIIEQALIAHKEIISTILQKFGSTNRVRAYSNLLNSIYNQAQSGSEISDEMLVFWAGLSGKIVVGQEKPTSVNFSNETKSLVFINMALKTEVKCPVCNGYIDKQKSISYDHILRVQDGGIGTVDNLQITHPYCNQSIRN